MTPQKIQQRRLGRNGYLDVFLYRLCGRLSGYRRLGYALVPLF